jgi:pimeloyl-ACP methyl ester carboxylesterase
MRKMTLAGAIAAAMLLALGAQAAPAAKPQDRYAQNGAVKIHYVVEGKGPLVVMIHGFPDYWATWKPLMATLSAAGYRTAALDTRGYNLSDKPEGVAAYAMPNLIGDVAAVIAAEGQKDAIVVGHDWGAAIAWQTVLNRPDLVNKLVIMAVPHPAGMARELATNKDQQANSQYARNFQKEGSEKMLTAERLASMANKNPAEQAGYLEAFKRSDFAAMMNYYRANYPRIAPGDPAPAPVTYPKIKVPVLVIHGMKDTALNAQGHAGTWNFVDADSTIVMIPTAGHWVQHDAEAMVDRTIKDWLNARR